MSTKRSRNRHGQAVAPARVVEDAAVTIAIDCNPAAGVTVIGRRLCARCGVWKKACEFSRGTKKEQCRACSHARQREWNSFGLGESTNAVKTFLSVPFEEKEAARLAGAVWHPRLKRWYVRHGQSLDAFARWLPPPVASNIPAVAAPASFDGMRSAATAYLVVPTAVPYQPPPRGRRR
ncbi:DUF5710 domain-containing protein [Caballeronia sp. LjRoot31]|uniref:DUF5710 domain-containing protein n=1 Tax=Caballeronia sp. LjRoot31 TaxID=3342324 RepID=UPI003ECD1708